jgi:hypothetical protein
MIGDGARSMLLPLVLREIPGSPGLRDATSAYGYPAPLFRGPGARTPEFISMATRALSEMLRSERIVSLFVRMHPVLNPDPAGFSTGTLLRHGETVLIDLLEPEEVQWRGIQSGHRNEIYRALRAGHEALLDTEWRYFDDFVRLYSDTMRRVEASRYYFFDRDYLEGLRAALGGHLHLAVVRIEGAVAAAGLFTEVAGLVQYHLSGTDERYARERPTKLMLHHVRQWAAGRGNAWFHLGGGLGAAADSLFKFKAGFSRHRRVFRTWRTVTDAHRYAELVRIRQPDADPADVSGYFPAYRKPLPPADPGGTSPG